MATDHILADDRTVEISRAILLQIAEGYAPRDFAVRFWNANTWKPDPGQPTRFTLVLPCPDGGTLHS